MAQDVYQPLFGKMVSIKTSLGKEVRLFEAKPGKWDGAMVILLHDVSGFNSGMIRMAEQLASATGAVVLLPDLLDKRSAKDSASARILLNEVSSERVEDIVKSCLDYGGKFSRVQTVGLGRLGGTWSLKAAILAGQRGYGAVVYYGKPVLDTAQLAGLAGEVLYLQARPDPHVPANDILVFEAQMKSVGRAITLKSIQSPHGFATPGTAAFRAEPSKASMLLVVDFLKKNFQIPMRKPAPSDSKKE